MSFSRVVLTLGLLVIFTCLLPLPASPNNGQDRPGQACTAQACGSIAALLVHVETYPKMCFCQPFAITTPPKTRATEETRGLAATRSGVLAPRDQGGLLSAQLPHEKSLIMHEHLRNSVGIDVTDFHAQITFPDGRTREVDAKAGQTMWRAPAVTHISTENLSNQPLEALWVELKSAAAPTPGGGSSKSEKDARSESGDKAGNAEQEVRQVERELTEALGQGDLVTIDRIYANDYTLTTVDGEVQDKARRITALKSTDPKKIARNRDDITVRVYGDTAVVTGRTIFRVRSKGEESSESRRFIHAWEKSEGRWQMVASQVTRVAEASILPKANGRSSASAANTEQATGTRETSVEQEIRRLEDERAEAFERGDIELVKRMSSDDYIATSVTGQVKNKAQVLEEMKSGGRRLKFIHDDIRVRVYGNTAVITGRSTRKGLENNNEVDDQVRFTGVYAKQNGRWLKVAQQATRIGH